jgi:hypothetical protein
MQSQVEDALRFDDTLDASPSSSEDGSLTTPPVSYSPPSPPINRVNEWRVNEWRVELSFRLASRSGFLFHWTLSSRNYFGGQAFH